jgi:DNA-binding transcriptional regulator PaaX
MIHLEDVVTLLTFGLEVFLAPSRHRYWPDDERWLTEHGWNQRLELLRRKGVLTRSRRDTGWIYRLTGSVPALDRRKRNPPTMWQRPWDGWWRQVVFDLPVGPGHRRMRIALLRWLRNQGFGYLQDSVWIRPDPVDTTSKALKELGNDAGMLTVLESRCVKGFTDAALVKAAWPFEEIERGYRQYEESAAFERKRLLKGNLRPQDLFSMLRREQVLWKAVFFSDPLLPRCLWPANYRGASAWHIRSKLIPEIGRQITAACK